MPVISVVIGTFNLKDKLLKVLDSFNNQNFDMQKTEVIVVDSSSTDGTENAVKKNKYRFKLNYLSVENKGKAAARNIGIKTAASDIIIITDADMIAHTDYVKTHYDLQNKNKREVIIQGKTWILSEEKLPPEKYLRRPYINKHLRDEQKLDFYYFLTGNLSLPKILFEKHGYFDENYTGYGWEDIDLGYRLIRKAKQKIIYAENAVNYHFHVWSDMDELQRREKMGQSVVILVNKYPELKWFLGINPLNRFLFLFLSKLQFLIDKWIEETRVGGTGRYKKTLLREFFYYRGYFRAISIIH
ncbi:MAG: glycosyltransferase [Candidatus Margulisbacteria bacterium]|nr:glycosyltransferase [Candidatus Margulisiibacteriota bacterium]